MVEALNLTAGQTFLKDQVSQINCFGNFHFFHARTDSRCAVLRIKTLKHTLRRSAGKMDDFLSLFPSNLGLGTSSILASAIVAALWAAVGWTFDKSSLIHCVSHDYCWHSVKD